MSLPVVPPLRDALLAAAVCSALPAAAQMPSPKEMEEAMREMREQMQKLTPEQRKMLEQAQGQLASRAAADSGDDVGVPRRDAARIAKVPRAPLTGAQLKAYVEALQPKLAQALSAAARQRAQVIERALQQQGGDVAAKLAAAANGLAAWGAWPEATYLMGKAARTSGSAQDLNNLAALLTMQKAGHAALPILITLDARYPNNATILNNLGQAWFELGELKEAERALRLALARAPNHPQANATQSYIEEARGDRAAAQASMRKAIAGGYSEGKERRLNKLGGRLAPGELRWTMKLPSDALGLSKFVPPPYAMKLSDLWLLPPSWQSFREDVEAMREKYTAQGAALAKQAPWLADAALRGPLTAKASRMSQLSGDDWMRRRDAAYGAYTDAIRFEQQERKSLESRLAAIHAEGEQKYRNVPGGYQYDYACPQIRAAITQYLEASGRRLDEARRGLLDYQRQTTNERLYYAQFMQSQRSFEYTVIQAKVEFLDLLRGLALNVNDGPGLLHQFGNSCLKPDRPGKSGGKLADFDEINCQHIVSFTVPGFGRIDVRCNRMDTTLDPIVVPFKAQWSEDLNKDRVLSASAAVSMKGVSVSGRGEFDDQGLARGGVQVGAGVSTSVGAGPLEVGLDASATVGIEFDRGGITDVRLEGDVGASVSSTVAGAGTQVNTNLGGTWSWNAGASATASGGFDRSVF
ncbi:tetratricopeptide repeat protein [Calidifontimicrobium sp. SYSU G02091]|uniref:tetratricopeptide repeat protein n=1 Tax=Calidifontimicrobium sp. SYSU G02091 TaxID=2926421 RepID=UPI001F53AF5E|nr:tetratricopeptide repeat protein [Calidifontimicrobium sp. SYSU G02091]MCI1193372.1 tetratricopeptide repeat protein [Calidifontimicrobium sp. SYSU G02091]